MSANQTVVQAKVINRPHINHTNTVQELALFGPDGRPISLVDIPTPAMMRSLKGRITKLENAIKELTKSQDE